MKCQSRDLKLFLWILPALAVWGAGSIPQAPASPSVQKDKVSKQLRLVATVKNFNSGVLVFSYDGKWLANGVDGKIQIWNTRTWKLWRTLRHSKIKPPFAFSPDGKTITLSTTDNGMQVWDVRRAKPLKTLQGLRTHIAFSPDGSLMAGWSVIGGKADETTNIWEARTGRRVQSLKNEASSTDQYVFSSNNRVLIVASADNFIKIYDVRSGKLISPPDATGDISPPLVLSPNGALFATIAKGGVVGDDPTPEGDVRPATDAGLPFSYSAKIWDARTGKLIRSFGGWATRDEPTALLGFTADSKKVIYNVGEKVAFGVGAHAVTFDVATGTEKSSFEIVNPVVLSPNGKILVGGGRTLKVWAMPN